MVSRILILPILLAVSFLFMGERCARDMVRDETWKYTIPVGTLERIEIHAYEGTVYQVVTTRGLFITHQGISGMVGSEVQIKSQESGFRYICIVDEIGDCAILN